MKRRTQVHRHIPCEVCGELAFNRDIEMLRRNVDELKKTAAALRGRSTDRDIAQIRRNIENGSNRIESSLKKEISRLEAKADRSSQDRKRLNWARKKLERLQTHQRKLRTKLERGQSEWEEFLKWRRRLYSLDSRARRGDKRARKELQRLIAIERERG